MVAFVVTKITTVKKGYKLNGFGLTTFIKLEYLKIFTGTRVSSFEKTDCEFVLLALSQISTQMLNQRKLQN